MFKIFVVSSEVSICGVKVGGLSEIEAGVGDGDKSARMIVEMRLPRVSFTNDKMPFEVDFVGRFLGGTNEGEGLPAAQAVRGCCLSAKGLGFHSLRG